MASWDQETVLVVLVVGFLLVFVLPALLRQIREAVSDYTRYRQVRQPPIISLRIRSRLFSIDDLCTEQARDALPPSYSQLSVVSVLYSDLPPSYSRATSMQAAQGAEQQQVT